MDADLVLTNASFYVDGAWLRGVDTVTIHDGRIVAMGARADAGRAARVVDLEGAWVLPGFHDAHVHPVQAGLEMNACDLSGGTSSDDYLAIIGDHARARPDAAWILGGGWSMDSFPGGVPTAGPLDRVVGDRPVFLPTGITTVRGSARQHWHGPASIATRQTRWTGGSSAMRPATRPVRCTRARWSSSGC